MRFLVAGTGGVGGYFGGLLARAGVDVWFLARGPHLQALSTTGLHVRSTDGDFVVPPGRMTGRAEDAGLCDVVLFCVKTYDTDTAARAVAPAVDGRTVVISLQNGIDSGDRLSVLLPHCTVYGGIAYVYATISAPGEVTETGGPRKIIFGPLDASVPDPRGERILDVCGAAGITATLSPSIRTDLWKKFVFISAVGGVTALTRLTLGEILSVPETRAMLEEAMRETAAVACAAGIALESSLIPGMFDTLKRFDNRSRSSLYYDLARGKPLEIEAFSGAVIRLGTRLGVPTPVHRVLYASLLPYHRLHQHAPHSSPDPR